MTKELLHFVILFIQKLITKGSTIIFLIFSQSIYVCLFLDPFSSDSKWLIVFYAMHKFPEDKKLSAKMSPKTRSRANSVASNSRDKSISPQPGKKLWGPVRIWCKIMDYLSTSIPGGPKKIKMAYVVNFQKCCTVLLCGWMMRRGGNTSPTATMYTVLHGGYGLCWLLKELVFPDAKWQRQITPLSAVTIFFTVLGPYWYIAYNAILRTYPGECKKGWFSSTSSNSFAARGNLSLAIAGIVCMVGLTLMVGADAQKYFVLKKERGLITNGFFQRVRHPNYLGEMMIYGSFAYVSSHWSSWLVLGWVWSCVFIPSMLQKEASMSRYPEWEAYQSTSCFLFPLPMPLFRMMGRKKQVPRDKTPK